MQSPRPNQTPSAARYGLLVLLLAFAGMLFVVGPSIDDSESGVSNYFVEAADDSRDAEEGGESILSVGYPLCGSARDGDCRKGPGPGSLRAQLATAPPSRAPPA